MPAKRDLSARQGVGNTVAVVSPCTSCKNHRLTYTDEGYWPCPRKVWAERARTETIENTVPDYLIEAGSTDDSGSLVNPVYAEDFNLILIWTADVAENCGLYVHGTDQVITPSILDPDFDSTYIKCSPLPSLPMETEASYYQNGAYKEGETVINFGIQPFQVPASDRPLLLAGFVKRLDVAFFTSYKTQDEDVIISGM